MCKPHKSTTHEERFYHIRSPFNGHIIGTVFFRKESDGKLGASVAIRSSLDPVNKRIGRQVARRKYFQGKRIPAEVMSYEAAYNLYEHVLDHSSNRVIGCASY